MRGGCDDLDVLALFRHAADDYLPCPSSWRMAQILRCSTDSVLKSTRRLVRDKAFRLESEGGIRRAIFPDGAMTDWTRRAPKRDHVTHISRPQDIELPPIPPDTRDLTGRMMGDPIQPREHEAWAPVYETASVTLPKLSFLDGATA